MITWRDSSKARDGPGGRAGCQGNQTPRAEKQSPEKTKPGDSPRAFTTSIFFPDLKQKPADDFQRLQPAYSTFTPDQTCKKELQDTPRSTPPGSLHSTDGHQDFKTCKASPPRTRLHPPCTDFKRELQTTPPSHLRPSNRAPKKNYKSCKPPHPPDCVPPDQTSKKNFRSCKPPHPNPDSIPPTSNLQKIGKRSAPPPPLFHDLRIARRL
jgi:hypothetical protein